MHTISTEQLSPSQIVLLRGEDFVRRRGNLVLPGGASVSMREMAETILTVAFLACAAHQDALELQIQAQKMLFGLWTVQRLFALPRAVQVPWPATTLEARLAQLTAQLPENRRRVQSIVHAFLGEDGPYPWRQIVAIAQGGLVAQGVLAHIDGDHWSMFEPRKKLHLARPVGLLDELDSAAPQELLAHYAQATPEIWRRLRQEIARGVSARNKRPHPLRENRQQRIEMINERRPFDRI